MQKKEGIFFFLRAVKITQNVLIFGQIYFQNVEFMKVFSWMK